MFSRLMIHTYRPGLREWLLLAQLGLPAMSAFAPLSTA